MLRGVLCENQLNLKSLNILRRSKAKEAGAGRLREWPNVPVRGPAELLRAPGCFKTHNSDHPCSEVVSSSSRAGSAVAFSSNQAYSDLAVQLVVQFVAPVDFHCNVPDGFPVAFHIRGVGPCFLRAFSLNREEMGRIKVQDQAHSVPARRLHLSRAFSRLKAVNTLAGCKAR